MHWKCDLYDWENYFIGVDTLMEFSSNITIAGVSNKQKI